MNHRPRLYCTITDVAVTAVTVIGVRVTGVAVTVLLS